MNKVSSTSEEKKQGVQVPSPARESDDRGDERSVGGQSFETAQFQLMRWLGEHDTTRLGSLSADLIH